jgi:hypothetical protein
MSPRAKYSSTPYHTVIYLIIMMMMMMMMMNQYNAIYVDVNTMIERERERETGA